MGDENLRPFDSKGLLSFGDTKPIPGEGSQTCGNPDCSDGFIAIWKDGRVSSVTDCECRKKKIFESSWRQVNLRKVDESFKKFNLAATILNDKIQPLDFGRKGYWMHGVTGQGKTHMTGWLIRDLIMRTQKEFSWIRVSMKSLFNAWELKRSPEEADRLNAKELLSELDKAEVVALGECDKFGNMTGPREEEIFDMFDKFYERGVKVIASSNVSIAEFCAQFKTIENKLKDRDGRAPIERRLRDDLCEEIKVIYGG